MDSNKEKTLINLIQTCTSYSIFLSQLEGILDIRINNLEGKKNYCGKRITRKEIGFECFTCSNKREHLLCKSCFEAGKHSGHLIAYSIKNTGFCDCGDYHYELNCSYHERNAFSSLDTKIVSNQESIISGIMILFYGVFQLCEILDTANDSSTLKEIRQKVQYSCEYTFDFLVKLTNESYTYSKLIETMLKRTLNKDLHHNCLSKNLEYLDAKSNCTCTILDNIVRYGFIYSYYTFSSIEKLLYSLYGEESFKKFWAQTYSKTFQLMIEKEENDGLCSMIKISRFHAFYLSFNSPGIHKLWLESNNFLNTLNVVTKNVIKMYFLGINNHSYDVFIELKEIYMFILKNSALKEILWKTNFVEGVIKILYILQKRNIKFEEDNEKCRLHIECTFNYIFKELLKIIKAYPTPRKAELLDKIIKDIIKRIFKLESKSGSRDNSWPLHIPLQRSLILSICSLIEIYGLMEIKVRFQDATDNFNKLILILAVNSIKAMKFCDQLAKKPDNMDLIQNPEESIKREVINAFYKKSFYLQYDCDLVTLQLICYMLQPNELFEFLAKIFDVNLNECKVKSNDQAYIKNFEYFLRNLIIIMIDEISFINCTSFLQSEKLWENQEEHIKFFFANALKMPKATCLVSIRNLVFNKLLNNELDQGKLFEIEKILDKIAIKGSNGVYRLKPEFNSFYEPYCFHKFSKMKSEFYDANKINECVIGKIKNPHFESLTFQIRSTLYKSDFPLLIFQIIETENYTSSCTDTLRLTLKLIHLGMHLHKSIPKICKSLLSPLMTDTLEKHSKNNLIDEFRTPIMKLLELASILSSSQRKESAIDILGNVKEENNKNLASKKQQDLIRKQLLAKQVNFLNNNQVLIERSNTEESDIICYICHSGINESSESAYGVLCFVSADNFIDFMQMKIGPINSKFRLCITSCQHFVHKVCQDANQPNNTRHYGDKRDMIFNNILECLCGQCKSLSNIFFHIVEKKYTLNNFHDFSEIISFKAPQELLCRYQKWQNCKLNKPIAKEASDFFDCLMRYLITNQDDKLDECIILNVGFNTLFEFCDNILLTGVTQFLKKKLMITKNFFLMFREYFWFFESKNKQVFVEKMKKEMGRDFSIIYNQNRLNQDFSLREFECCSLRLAWQAGIIFKEQESVIYSSFIYISRHTFSVYILYLCFGSYSKPNENISLFKEELKNYDFQRIIAAGIIEYARKLVVIILSIFHISDEALRDLEEADMLDELEELKLYDKIFGCDIFKISLDNTPYIDALIPALHSIVANKGGSPDFLLSLISTVKLPALPNIFSEFYVKYVHNKCEICEDFPLAGSPYLCLLCAKIFCSISCVNNKNARTGSLNHHAKKSHLGKCVFINVITSMVIAISWPRMVVIGFLYKDINNKRPLEVKNYHNFQKDMKLNQKVEDIILGRRIPQEVVYRILDNDASLITFGYL